MRTACLFLVLALSTEYSVLSAAPGASLSGVVRDPQGSAVAGANLALYSRTASVSVNTASDSSGGYHFDGLPPGDYILRAEAAGFATFFDENLRFTADSPKSIDIALQLAGIHEEVVVTASSTPQVPQEVSKSMTVIDHAEIDDRDKAALADAVNLAPSLRVQQLGGPGAFTTIQIRGLRTEDTAVLVDGIRLRDSSSTQGDASGLIEDLFVTDTNRVEILRGSGSSLYGTNAIGGVINVITDEGGGRTRGSVLTEGGSLGMFRGRAQLSGSLDGDQIPYSFGATQTYVGNGVDGDDPYRSTSLQGRVDVPPVTFNASGSPRIRRRCLWKTEFRAGRHWRTAGERHHQCDPTRTRTASSLQSRHAYLAIKYRERNFYSRSRQSGLHPRGTLLLGRFDFNRPAFPSARLLHQLSSSSQ